MSKTDSDSPAQNTVRWLGYCLILGLYFTLRGYHSLDGDQAYRLPLLIHQADPSVYPDDPFIQAFDTFNPHRGSLMLLRVVTGAVGLPAGLLILFVTMFLVTCWGVDRLGSCTWPESTSNVGLIAVVLVLLAKAGNLGTNHLFEAILLDRLMGMTLGWVALGLVMIQPERGWWISAILLGLAALIHPSLGLQLALIVMGSWVAWAVLGSRSRVSGWLAFKGASLAGLSVVPGLLLNLGTTETLLKGISPADFWTLAVELQGPQHMLPHLWRMPQWLAWGCYLLLALTAVGGSGWPRWAPQFGSLTNQPAWPPARIRLVVMLGVVLAWLGVSWIAIEGLHHLRITLFQPFRMATLRAVSLSCWSRGESPSSGSRVIGWRGHARWSSRLA